MLNWFSKRSRGPVDEYESVMPGDGMKRLENFSGRGYCGLQPLQKDRN
jgi:hypothetical protein